MNLRLGYLVKIKGKDTVENDFVLVGDNDNIVQSASSIKELAGKVKKDSGEKKIKLLKQDEIFIHVLSNPESTKNVQSSEGESIIMVRPCEDSCLVELYKKIV
jgi:hypothetical protein